MRELDYSTADVAKMLGVSVETVRRYARAEKLKSITFAPYMRLRFTESAIMSFLMSDSMRLRRFLKMDLKDPFLATQKKKIAERMGYEWPLRHPHWHKY